MGQNEMKKCPYCAELIKREAIKCRYCGSMLTEKKNNFDFLSTPGYWHRVNEGKKIAGVCTGIARQLDAPMLILPLRLFFILTTLFYGFGFILYIILWALMAPPTDSPGMMASGTRSAYPPPSEGPDGPPPPPSQELSDNDFDYVEGSTPTPEEFRPEPETGTEPETDTDNTTGETSIQKRLLFIGMFATLILSTYFAGKVYIAVVSDIMLPFPVQIVIVILGISTIFAAYKTKTTSCRHYSPVAVVAD